METGKQASEKRHGGMSAVELLSLGGFSFVIAWIFVGFFWLFSDFPPEVPVDIRDLTQFALFGGIFLGYVVLHFLGKAPRFNLFSIPAMGFELIGALLLPSVAFAMFHSVHVPLGAVLVISVISGAAVSWLIVSWLDVLSRIHTSSFGRFTGCASVLGALLFVFAVFLPIDVQPVFGFIYILLSLCLLVFATQNADANDERADLESTESPWKFTKEIEPSFFMFGVVFALGFVFLFNSGSEALLPGMLCVIPGGAVVAVAYWFNRQADITVIQRILLIITVLSCVLMPFSPGIVQVCCACLVVATWAAFKAINYAFIVQKCTVQRTAPLFRQAPARLAVSAAGFAVGWGIAAVITCIYGAHTGVFGTVRLAMAFILVLTVMAFFPIGRHHLKDGTAQVESQPAGEGLYSVQMNESELLERRCEAIAKLYQLSPRESDILVYLARGRNAAWIQEELVISPHTVKSHIYNIYRKLDIHSQQKLMSFVEEYPLEG